MLADYLSAMTMTRQPDVGRWAGSRRPTGQRRPLFRSRRSRDRRFRLPTSQRLRTFARAVSTLR
jgi:hypothetical protein